MLKFLLASSCLVVSILAQSEAGDSESHVIAGSNFFQYTFNSLLNIPYAADQCSATDLTGTSYIIPVCVDDNTIEVSWYSDSSCTSLSSQNTYNTSSGEIFVCSGSSSYSGITIGVSECLVTFYASFRSCVQHSVSSSAIYSSIECSSTEATMSLYNTSTCSNSAMTEYYFSDTCSYSFTFSSYDIFGEIASCTVEATPTTSSGGENSESEVSESESDDGNQQPATTGSDGGSSDDANRISFNNIVGIFVMIGSIIIAKLW